MLILDKPRDFNGKYISLPLYHRGHLSLFSNAKVWLCFLPSSSINELPQLIVSPISPKAWSDLWQITVSATDRPGIVHKIFDVLKSRSINIVACESSSIEAQSIHTVAVIVDASEYRSDHGLARTNLESKIEDLPSLRRALLAELIPYIKFTDTGEPRLEINRVRSLFSAASQARRRGVIEAESLASTSIQEKLLTETDLQKLSKLKPPKTGSDGSLRRSRIVENTRIALPDAVRDALHDNLKFLYPSSFASLSESEKVPWGRYLMVSETNQRFLSAYFIPEQEPIIAVTLEHDEKIGALESITDALQRVDFNILTSLSRLYEFGKRAQCELVLKAPPDLANQGIEAMQIEFLRALRFSDTVHNYNLMYDFNHTYRNGFQPKLLNTSPYVLPKVLKGGARDVSTQQTRPRGNPNLEEKTYEFGRPPYFSTSRRFGFCP